MVAVVSAARLAADVVEALTARANAERREHTLGYFPTRLNILGVSAPDMRAVLRPLARQLRGEGPKRILAVARALCVTRVHEARQVAWELIGGRADVVAGLDASTVERLGRGNDNWATVDSFSVHVSGPAWREGGVRDADIRRWAGSADLWWRRTALVSTVALNLRSRGGHGDPTRTLQVCELLARDEEPMVAKALSWALRATVAHDAPGVRAFLHRYGDELPALVRREVGNKLATGRKNGRS